MATDLAQITGLAAYHATERYVGAPKLSTDETSLLTTEPLEQSAVAITLAAKKLASFFMQACAQTESTFDNERVLELRARIDSDSYVINPKELADELFTLEQTLTR